MEDKKSSIDTNKIKCAKCGCVVVSKIDNVFKSCCCGHIKISGGKSDTIRVLSDGLPATLNEDYIELSTYVFND